MLNPNALRITQLLGFYCAAAHWLACGFFWLGRWQLQNTSLGGSNEFTGDPWLVVWCLQAASGGFSGLGEGLCSSIVPLLYPYCTSIVAWGAYTEAVLHSTCEDTGQGHEAS